MRKLLFQLLCFVAVMMFASVVFAQNGDPEIPGFGKTFFSTEFLGAVTATIAASKVFRNLLGNIKGTPALLLTIGISIGVGEFTFLQSHGFVFGGLVGLFSGLVAAGVFTTSKLFGKNVVKLDKS